MKHCPNCVTELQENKKKLGRNTKWLVCPNCGLRVKPTIDIETPHIVKGVKRDKTFIEDEANGRYNL